MYGVSGVLWGDDMSLLKKKKPDIPQATIAPDNVDELMYQDKNKNKSLAMKKLDII